MRMSPIFCPCGKTITPLAEWAGKRIRCTCGQELYVPQPAPEEQAVSETKRCPYCAEVIRAEAIRCRYCDQNLSGGIRRPAPAAVPATDDGGHGPLVVGILGWMLCGLLHPVAWAMGASYEAQCRERGVEPGSAGRAGRLLGMIGTILCGIGILFFVLLMILAA